MFDLFGFGAAHNLHAWMMRNHEAEDLRRSISDAFAVIPPRYRRCDAEPIVDIVRRIVADADAERADHDKTRCELAGVRDNLREAIARHALAEKTVAKYADMIHDLRDAAERRERDITHMRDRRDIEIAEANQARDEALAEVARLETLIGKARNQLDGRKHHPDDEPVFLPLYTPEVLM